MMSTRSERMLKSAKGIFDASPDMFAILTDAMPQMVWSTRPDGFHDYYNARWYEFTGVPAGSTDGEGWNGMFHPDDQERARQRWTRSLETGEPYEIEYRLRRHDGVYRWTLGRANPIRDADGRFLGTMYLALHSAEPDRTAEIGWILEDNKGMVAIADAIGSKVNREYNVYGKAL